MAQWQPSIFTPDKAADQRRTAASLSAKTISQSLNRTFLSSLYMPVRGLIYFSKLYEDYILDNGLDLYSSTQLLLPRSQFFVSTTEHPNSLTARYLSSAILSRMIILKITWRYVRLCSTSTMVITKLS